MKKKSSSQSAFFNLRVLIGLFIALAGVFLALLGFGAFSAQAQQKYSAQAQQKYNATKSKPSAVKGDGKFAPVRMMAEALPGPVGFVGLDLPARVPGLPTANALINNNAGSTGITNFTQSENTVVAFGSTIVVCFNDSGSFVGGASKFTGWSRSTDNGATWTDGGTLPTSALGDAGDPVLARDETTGRIYFATLGFNPPTRSRSFVPLTMAPHGWRRSMARPAEASKTKNG